MLRPEVPTVADFVANWLALRARNPEAGAAASALIGPLSARLDQGAEDASRFLDLIYARLSGLIALGRAVGPSGAPGSPIEEWSRLIRQVDAGWRVGDPGSWWPDFLDLTDRGNGLVRAAISASLADALAASTLPRPVASALARLRQAYESPYRKFTVPPAPSASWEAGDYLNPPAGAAAFASARAGLGDDSGEEPDPDARSWSDLADAHAAGWPVAFAELAAALRGLLARRPDLATDATLAALGSWSRASGPASPAPAPGADLDPVAGLAGRLEAGGSAEALAFAGRLRASAGPDRARRLIGCLISLDELAEGEGRAWDWTRPARDGLLEVAREVEGCQILDRTLLGQPVRHVADAVVAVGLDEGAPAAERNRITRVERPGYALVLPDGSRQILTKARVRLGS